MQKRFPYEAEIVERIDESDDIFTLRLKFCDSQAHQQYSFQPGQFNMLYLHGVGEVPISIVSDPQDEHLFDHTIRRVGRVTEGLAALQAGERLGIRGPFGTVWPLQQARGQDVIIVTGGLGCAPVVAAINYILRRRDEFGRLIIFQGVRHSADLIWRSRYEQWDALPNTDVFLAANQADALWPWHVGYVPDLFDKAEVPTTNTTVMMCGPEGMMVAATNRLLAMGMAEEAIWLSMERNMQCGMGRCGHCQLGPHFICKSGPVLPYTELKTQLCVKGL